MEEQIKEPTRKKGNGKMIVIVLLALLLGGSVINNFLLWNKGKNATTLANNSIDSLNAVNLLKDSLYIALAEEEASIASLRTEISMYQSENDSLKQVLDEKIKNIGYLRAQIGANGSPAKLRALKDSISRITHENKDFKTKVQALLLENEDYRAQLAMNAEKIGVLNTSNQQLSDKVIIASEPNVGPIVVTPMSSRKGVFTPNYKAKKVEKLVISFDILGNKLTERKIEKTYVVRIKDPDEIVLSNDNDLLVNSDDVYTVRENVNFDGTQQKIKVDFSQKPRFKKGRYQVELKDGEDIKQTFTFNLL